VNVGKASDWLREERRKVLGDWAAFCLACGSAQRWFEEFEAELPATCPACGGELLHRCLACGSAQRWFEEFEAELPATCPACGGELLHRCPACNAPFSSAFAVECEECGGKLREAELFGGPIRRAR